MPFYVVVISFSGLSGSLCDGDCCSDLIPDLETCKEGKKEVAKEPEIAPDNQNSGQAAVELATQGSQTVVQRKWET